MKIYPYKQGSKSAKALADALGIKQLKDHGPHLHVKGVVINWGCSHITRNLAWDVILNNPLAVTKAANKLETFKALSHPDFNVSVPEWTEDKEVAEHWPGLNLNVVCRAKLNGHSGEGITIASKVDEIVDAPLYTGYIKKKDEYRIHVFQGEAFFVQRKARKLDVPAENVNWKVRNLAGGFIFAHKDVEVDDVARREAVAAVAALALDFGAVDIIHGTDGKYYVLEVNTACGLEGETLAKYVEKFKAFK